MRIFRQGANPSVVVLIQATGVRSESSAQTVIGLDEIMNSVRNATVPVTLLLDRGGECNEVAIPPTTPDQLQRNWQTAIVEADGKRHCRQPQHVDEAAITTEIVEAPAAEAR